MKNKEKRSLLSHILSFSLRNISDACVNNFSMVSVFEWSLISGPNHCMERADESVICIKVERF